MIISAFGDSNTYGYDPRLGGGGRYPYDVRWTGRLDRLEGVSVKNYGHNGECIPKRADFISARCTADRPDVVLLMYGTNDILIDSRITLSELQNRMRKLLHDLINKCPDVADKLILIAPPSAVLGAWTDAQVVEKTQNMAACYKRIADETGVGFADASEWEPGLCFDGVHLSEEGHERFFEGIRKNIGI